MKRKKWKKNERKNEKKKMKEKWKEKNESLDLISRKHGYDMVMALEDIQSELKSYCEQDQIRIDMS